MRILALDVGDERIGVAISDPSQVIARSLKVIERARGVPRRSRQGDSTEQRFPPAEFDDVVRLVEEYEVEKVVVGYPRSLDGEAHMQADKVERYALALAESLAVPVILWDERFSTVTAERLMREAGVSAQKGRGRVDAVAAAVILQDYLDSS